MKLELHRLLSPRIEHRLLGLMLIVLHLALWWDFPGAISRSLMLTHLGMFLIWQPVWSRERRLDGSRLLIFSVVTVGFAIWLDWWLIAFWLVLLIGLVGGRVTRRRADRTAYMIAGMFLLLELLIGVIPAIFEVSAFSDDIARPLGYGLLGFPISLLFIAGQPSTAPQSRPVDFLYGLTVALLVTILVLGSLLSMYHFGSHYPVALLQTVLGIALFLLAISWLWTPFAGFTGLGLVWTRYLLNVGAPFEHWLARVSMLADRGRTPEEFLEAAVDSLLELPWIQGCDWRSASGRGSAGQRTEHSLTFEIRELTLILYTTQRVSTSLQLHGQLLVQLLSDFHQAKRREQELAQKAHLQAIHETGARVTHDIKNLLQSLYALAVAVKTEPGAGEPETQALIRRQLPFMTQRLERALNKLQAPARETITDRPFSDWWRELCSRHAADSVEFTANLSGDVAIPGELFDSVVENLLENARFKRQSEPQLSVKVEADAGPERIRVRVVDDGSPVPRQVAGKLFRGPVTSDGGLGIGLYQSYRQAAEQGFTLTLDQSRPGHVQFELTGPPSGESTGDSSDRTPGALRTMAGNE